MINNIAFLKSKKIFINTQNFFKPEINCYFAETKSEIKAAQILRYKVFFSERDNKIIKLNFFKKETDHYDKYSHHLIVTFKRTKFSQTQVIGTYRLLDQSSAQRHSGFYSENEFNLSKLLRNSGFKNMLELSRSCIHKKFRNKNILQLMWKNIHQFIVNNKIDALFGTASFLETNLFNIESELKFLNSNFSMPENIAVEALEHCKVNLREEIDSEQKYSKEIIKKIPTLIKAYLRLGAYIGDGAVIDHHFKTTDVFVFLPFSRIKETYLKKFSNK